MTQRKSDAARARQAPDGIPTEQSSLQRSGNGHAHTDEQIGREVQMRLRAAPAARATRLLVSVGDGIVTLVGEVDDESERLRLLETVRQVTCVREVRDELSVRRGHLRN